MKKHITSASTRKNRPDHGSFCTSPLFELRSVFNNTRARLVFPVTTSVRDIREEKWHLICIVAKKRESIEHHEEGLFDLIVENDHYPKLNWVWDEFYNDPTIYPNVGKRFDQ